jgi:uncharacterized membrane protein YeiB
MYVAFMQVVTRLPFIETVTEKLIWFFFQTINFVFLLQGPMLWFLKYFRQKIRRKKLAFLTQNKAKLCKMLIVTLVFEKNANFFAENCQKSQKIVIITSTPDCRYITTFFYLCKRVSMHWVPFPQWVPSPGKK